MAALLTTHTTNGAGSGFSHSGPATVFVRGTFDGATVVVEVSDDDSTYLKADNVSPAKSAVFREKGCTSIDGQGTYYIRCVVSDAGALTSITAVSTQ